jgi:hypothetical protein
MLDIDYITSCCQRCDMGDRINVKSGASSFLGFTRIYVLSLFFYKFRKPLAKSFVLFFIREKIVCGVLHILYSVVCLDKH